MQITEQQFSQQVEELLEIYHWRWCHFRPARTLKKGKYGWRTAMSGDQGFPDYIAVRNGKLLIFELKSDKGKPSNAQVEWLMDLMMVAAAAELRVGGIIEVKLWKPENWDEIVEMLGENEICPTA